MTFVTRLSPVYLRCLVVLLGLTVVGVVAVPTTNAAEWREKATRYVVIFHQPEHANTADQLAATVDPIVEQMAALHDYTIRRPLVVRLYASTEAYAQSSDLARTSFGQVAQVGGPSAELAIAEPRLRNLTPEQVRNLFRRGLSHIMVDDAARGRLPLSFLLGAAQYSERPTPEVEVGTRLLDKARRERASFTWADLANPDRFGAQAEIAAAQSYSMVAFLLDRYGLVAWQRFLIASRAAPDIATALGQGYGKSASALESEWEAYLPEYFGGSFNVNHFARYELGAMRELLQAGRYFEARDELEAVARFIAGAGRTAKETELRDASRQVAQGIEADTMLQQGQAQLAGYQYATARETFDAARQRFEIIGAAAKVEEAGQAMEAAASGVSAIEQLEASKRLVAEYKYPEARDAAVVAIKAFASLGDEEHYRQSYLIIQELDTNITRLAYLIAALALASAVWAGWRMASLSRRAVLPGVLQ